MPLSDEEIQKKREEAERKARRGEIDPMHEYAFQVICQVRDLIVVMMTMTMMMMIVPNR